MCRLVMLDVAGRRSTLVFMALATAILALESGSHHAAATSLLSCTLGSWDGFGYSFEQMITKWPNLSRGCVKTVMSKNGNDQFCDMRYVVEMSRRIQWSKNEFSHSLSPEPPPITHLVPHSRLTDLAARLSFCRGIRAWTLHIH